MREKIRSHKELRVFTMAMDGAMEIFNVTKAFPKEEKYAMTDQIRRSSRSVCANLAEAWSKRRYGPAFVAKLNDAEGEADETQAWIEFARRCDYLSEVKAAELDDIYNRVVGQIVVMMRTTKHWLL